MANLRHRHVDVKKVGVSHSLSAIRFLFAERVLHVVVTAAMVQVWRVHILGAGVFVKHVHLAA